MSPETRETMKERLLEMDNETLFDALKLDLDDIFRSKLESMGDDELLKLYLELT